MRPNQRREAYERDLEANAEAAKAGLEESRTVRGTTTDEPEPEPEKDEAPAKPVKTTPSTHKTLKR